MLWRRLNKTELKMNEMTEQSVTKLQHAKYIKKQTHRPLLWQSFAQHTFRWPVTALFLQNSKLNEVSGETNVNIESLLHNKSFMW